MNNSQIWLMILVMALVTILLRFLPFIVFNNKEKVPTLIKKLSTLLPYAVMGMLVVYCLKDTSFKNIESFLPTIISCFVVSILYIWKRNTLVSIVFGTVCYMLLVQLVF